MSLHPAFASPDFSCKSLKYNFLLRCLFAFIIPLFIPTIAHSQCAGAVDPTFALTGTGLDREAYCSVRQPDGKILLGGDFTTYDGVAQSGVVRLNADGTRDMTFAQTGTGLAFVVGSGVRAIALQPDGKILVAGMNITGYNGTAVTSIVRLNADGSRDMTFSLAGTGLTGIFGFPGVILSLTLQPDGKILIGGSFTDYNGTAVGSITRLNADGSLDGTFALVGTGFNGGAISSILLQPDGKIVVAGLFFTYNGATPRGCIARLNADGTLDASFVPTGTGLNTILVYPRFDMALQPDNKIIVFGSFTEYNGISRNSILRLNADGTLDGSFNPGLGFDDLPLGSNGQGNIQLQPDGKIIVVGAFLSYNGISNFIDIRINADGTIDNTFLSGSVAIALAWTSLLLPSGDIIIAGTNRVYGASAPPTLASFTPMSALAGATVTITGTNFCTVSAVSFGGTAAAAFTVDSPTQITATVGAGATGSVSVTTPLGTVALAGFTFLVPGSAAYSGTTFPEAAANDGTITQTRTVTLTGDTWIPAGAFTGGGTHFTATGVPAGLAIAITRITPTVAQISFTGTAAAHANANDATVTLNFTNAAVASGNAAGITGLNPASLLLDFSDATATLSGSTFPEDAANTGTITATQDVTLTGDTWIPAGAFASPADFTATGVPAGLAIAVNRISATVARISFTGAAAAHAAANNTSVTVNFTNAALAGGNAGAVTGLNPITLAITFLNPPAPPPPPPPTPPTAPTAFQLGAAVTLQASFNLPYGLSLVANGSPTPTYSLVAGALPPGIVLSSSGVLSGTPTQQGGYTFTVSASNSAGSTMTIVTLVVGPPRPLATFVEQTSGAVGSVVVIRGYNFSNATSVSFGGTSALSFTVDNDSQITAIVGFGNSGTIQVSTPNGTSSAPQGFTYFAPPPPAITSVNPAAAVSGDENYRIVLRGRNFSPFATYSVQPETGTSASFAVRLETVQEFVNSTEAYLVLPLASRTLGIKRVVVQLGNAFASATFAVVAGAKPQILSQTVPSTIASSLAFTTELTGTGFFRFGYGRLTVNGELANASVLDAGRARVEIPARLNILGSKIAVRITNYDGQFAETTVNVVSRVAPAITQVVSRLEDSRIRMIVRGSGFWGVQSVLVQNQSVLLIRTSPAELEIELPRGFPRPSLTEEAWVLIVENPDGQKYGFRLTPSLFYPPNGGSSSSSVSSIIPKVGAETQSANVNAIANVRAEANIVAGAGQLNISPNPVSETLQLEVPAFAGVGHLQVVNARGEEVFSGAIVGGERTQVDVRSLVSGAYFVRVVGEGVRVVSRITVIR